MSPADPAPESVPASVSASGPAPGPVVDGEDRATAPARASLGLALLGSEITLLFRRRRTVAMLLALAAVPVLIAVAVRISSAGSTPGRGPAFLASITENGLFVALTGLTVSIPLFLPLTVGVVAGDTIAGEANLGTLRYLLIAPSGRLRLLLVKYAGVIAYCIAATVVIVVAGILIGLALFPIGPVTLLSGDTIGVGDYLLRAVLLAGYVTSSMLGLGAIGLFVSTITSVPVGAMATTVVISAVSQILDALPQLSAIHPFLFSHYWLSFGDLLRQPLSFDSFGSNAVLQLAYVAIFGALAIGRFTTKDVLS